MWTVFYACAILAPSAAVRLKLQQLAVHEMKEQVPRKTISMWSMGSAQHDRTTKRHHMWCNNEVEAGIENTF